jgi:hypothetical protein
MTVSVMDLPVAAPTTRSTVAVPVARLPQVAAPAPRATQSGQKDARDAAATDDSDDSGSQSE